MRIMTLIFNLLIFSSLALASSGGGNSSGGGGGGAAGGAVGGASNRTKESQPAKVQAARKELRERMQKRLASETNAAKVATIDHDHKELTALLKSTVTMHKEGRKSSINYSKVDKAALNKYTDWMLAVSKDQVMNQFTREQRLAYFINLYNAMTIKLIVDNKKVKSIKDLGSWFSSPWKKSFFKLFGKDSTLDEIEHGYIRGVKEFNEPRIHFAVNCASIGCPALLDEAFVASKLETQLQTAMVNFLKDRDRNRYNKKNNEVELSKIFSWYKEDFEKGFLGYSSLKGFVKQNAAHLTDNEQDAQALANASDIDIDFTSYDWNLNDNI